MAQPAFWSMLLTILGISLYHLAQRSIPSDLNPFVVVLAVYLVASVFCLGLLRWVPGIPGEVVPRKLLHPSVLLLALACLLIELGFLWVYRAGWKMAVVPLVANCTVTVLLTVAGWLLFRETPTLRQWLGITASAAGLWLMSRGG